MEPVKVNAPAIQCRLGGTNCSLQSHRQASESVRSRQKSWDQGTPGDSGSAGGYYPQEASPIVLEFLSSLQRGGYQERFPTFQSAQSLALTAVSRCKNQRDLRYLFVRAACNGRTNKVQSASRHPGYYQVLSSVEEARVSWILQVVCQRQPELLPKTGESIGLDFGIKDLVSDSAGGKVGNPIHLKRSLRKLRVAQSAGFHDGPKEVKDARRRVGLRRVFTKRFQTSGATICTRQRVSMSSVTTRYIWKI